VPLQTGGQPLSIALGVALSLLAISDLLLLAVTRRFDRYVVVLLAAGTIFVPAATAVGGGVTGPTAGLAWAFLVPRYAIMALGPRQATAWFLVFLGMVLVMLAIDPLVRGIGDSAPYPTRLLGVVNGTVVPLTIVFLLLRYTDLRRRTAERRANELLANAIPQSIADRLRHGEQRIAEAYPHATILFADLVESTPWERQTDPATVVALLDRLFTRFDRLAVECGTEKIKTIGDAYMAASGAPIATPDHADRALRLGIAILDAVAEERTAGGIELEVRVGLASGPVVGGVIGEQRASFDLWGDTVNVASRMESTGIRGRIQVAASTWEILRERYEFEPRQVEVKGIGDVTAYVLRT
jgi:class 3 adenylate cyclase